MTSFCKNSLAVELKAEPEAVLEVRESGRTCAGALDDDLVDLDLDLAWDIDGGGESSSEISMTSWSEGVILVLDGERWRVV